MMIFKSKISQSLILFTALFSSYSAQAHYPFVAPTGYQIFNNQIAILSGFYDNPFASEVAIKNFAFHYHKPNGEKISIVENDWAKTQSLSSYTLATKEDGTYRIRGVKQGETGSFALIGKEWKPVIHTAKNTAIKPNEKVVYVMDLKKNTVQKTVQTTELIETFVSRKAINHQVIHHIHDGFDIEFLTHPNQIKKNENIQFKLLDDKNGIANLKVEILTQTHDFSREEKVFKNLTTDQNGLLNFKIEDKGQYLLKVDYQQPFSHKAVDLKRYKYTLAFNVID